MPPSVAIRAVAELSFGSISYVAMRSERMIMVYFTKHRLLNGSDLVQKMRDGNFFMHQYLGELIQAVTRENLTVDNVISMHGDKLPWTEITGAIGRLN